MWELAADVLDRFRFSVNLIRGRIPPIRDEYDLDDKSDCRIRHAWMAGYTMAINAEVHQFLKREYGSQERIAEFLGLENRSTVSKNRTRQTLTSEQIWTLLKVHPEVMEILDSEEVEERAVVEGYLESVSWTRKHEMKDSSCQRCLTHEEYECLNQVLSSQKWVHARRTGDDGLLEEAGMSMLEQVHEEIEGERQVYTVEDINRLIDDWGRAFCLCIDALASYIG